MIAIAKIGGHQEIVKVGDKLEVDKLDTEVGKTIKLDVLLISDEDGGNFQIGAPTLENMYAEVKILEHGRGDKIRVFKMKPRKRYRRTLGHRQDYTVIEVTKLVAGKAPAKSASKENLSSEALAKEEKTISKKPAAKPVAKKSSPVKSSPKAKATKSHSTEKAATKKAPAKKVEKTPKKS